MKDVEKELWALGNLGNTYLGLGQYQKAIQLFEQQRTIAGTKSWAEEGKSLRGLAIAYLKTGKYDEALEAAKQFSWVAYTIGGFAGSREAGAIMGEIYLQQGNYPEAIKVFEYCFDWAKPLEDKPNMSAALSGLGVVYTRMGNYQRALNLLSQALIFQRQTGQREQRSITLSRIGDVFAVQNKPEMAIAFYKQAINERETIRQDIRTLSREDQQSYKETIKETYLQLAKLLLEQNRTIEGLFTLDLLKTQEIRDFLQNTQSGEITAQKIDLLPQEQQILQSYTSVQELFLQQLQNLPSEPQKRIDQTEQIRKSVSPKMTDFFNTPQLAALAQELKQTAAKQNLKLPVFQDVQSRLNQLGDKVALFYSLVLNERLELVVLTPTQPPIRKTVFVKRHDLEQAISTFRKDLQNPNSQNIKQSSLQLYQWLIQPIKTHLQKENIQTIIYAPDGQMRYIPLAALYDGKQWLVEQFQLNYLTSLALTKLDSVSLAPPRILAGAFTTGSYRFEVAGKPFSFNGLPFTRLEVEQLAELIPGTTKIFDKDFSRAAILSQVNNYTIIHLATHAVFVPGLPEESFIVMGDGSRISLREISDWKLPNVSLFVLSACQTAVGGELGNGLEILGFGYQLQQTGSRAAIASLWEVNDQGTQTLMNEFYAVFKQGNLTTTKALQQAQIAMIRGTKLGESKRRSSVIYTPGQSDQLTSILYNTSHPYYWAPFILIGNGL